jgi:hypothetical protein
MGLADIGNDGRVPLSMGRVKCATLPLNALKLGLKEAGKL